MWGTFLSEPLSIVVLVGRYPANKLMERIPIDNRNSLIVKPCGFNILSDINLLVKQRLAGELELLLQESGQKEEERFRLLDETIRSFQKAGQEEAAATKVPFFKRKRFGRGAKKLFHREKRS